MARIALPTIPPFWDTVADSPPKWSSWKFRLDTMLKLSVQLGQKLNDEARNQLLFAYLGAEGARRFETDPRSRQQETLTYDQYSAAAAEIFDTPVLPALAFFNFRSCKQQPHETVSDYVSRLRTLQADCDYANFSADVDLAYVRLVTELSQQGIAEEVAQHQTCKP